MLTSKEREFLASQGLTENDVFHAKGRSIALVRSKAKQLDKTIIIGSPCTAVGHRLRTRYGHCAQCKPANLAYQSRASVTAYVYIAFSADLKLIKVGSSTDYQQRIQMLNSIAYGNTKDWRVVFWVFLKDAGKVETDAHRYLLNYLVETTYQKDGHPQISRECFRCSVSKAMQELVNSIERRKLRPLRQWMDKSIAKPN